MGRIALIGFHNLFLMQFLYKYTDIFDREKISYDVLYWDRDVDANIELRQFSGKKIAFQYKMSNFQPKYKKIGSFIKCLKFISKKIEEGNYDKIILLTTQTALPLYLFSRTVRKKTSYVFDYRDLTYEKNGICRKLIKRIIQNSQFTAISSYGFKGILGESDKYVLSHNCSNIERVPIKHKSAEKIHVVFWGMIRQAEFNKKVCDLFGSNTRFELFYHGDGYVEELIEYIKEKRYHNIFFTGRYATSQIPEFAANTDILLNLYENDDQQKLAMTVKLYDGIRYGLPMLITQGSYMASILESNSSVFCLDIDNINSDDIAGWIRSIDIANYPYSKELQKIQKDDLQFSRKLIEFVNE